MPIIRKEQSKTEENIVIFQYSTLKSTAVPYTSWDILAVPAAAVLTPCIPDADWGHCAAVLYTVLHRESHRSTAARSGSAHTWPRTTDTWTALGDNTWMHICIFKSLRLEGSCVGDLLYSCQVMDSYTHYERTVVHKLFLCRTTVADMNGGFSGDFRGFRVLVFFFHFLFQKAWASQVVQVVENLPASAGDIRDAGSIPGSVRSPEEGISLLISEGLSN